MRVRKPGYELVFTEFKSKNRICSWDIYKGLTIHTGKSTLKLDNQAKVIGQRRVQQEEMTENH